MPQPMTATEKHVRATIERFTTNGFNPDRPDVESLSLHLRAEAHLRAQGKDPKSVEAEEYLAACEAVTADDRIIAAAERRGR